MTLALSPNMLRTVSAAKPLPIPPRSNFAPSVSFVTVELALSNEKCRIPTTFKTSETRSAEGTDVAVPVKLFGANPHNSVNGKAAGVKASPDASATSNAKVSAANVYSFTVTAEFTGAELIFATSPFPSVSKL